MIRSTTAPGSIPTPREVFEPRSNRAQRRARSRATRHYEFSATFYDLGELQEFLDLVRRDASGDGCS